MINKKTNTSFLTGVVLITMLLGLSGCYTKHERTPQIRVQDFVQTEVVDGNLAFRHKATGQKMEVISCGSKYQKECPSTNNGYSIRATEQKRATITFLEKQVNSVDCFIMIQIRDYPPIQIAWHEEGDACSAGQQVR